MTIKTADINFLDCGKIISNKYDDFYFQPDKGAQESEHVFIKNNDLESKFKNLKDDAELNIAEFGFGTGLNCILAINLFQKIVKNNARLSIVSFEKYPINYADLVKIYASLKKDDPYFQEDSLILDQILEQYPQMLPGIHHLRFNNIDLYLHFGDVKDYLFGLKKKVDIWFLDGFSPAKNPDMWSEQLLLEIGRKSNKNASFSTFTAAKDVKETLERAGFEVNKVRGFGRKRNMLTGVKPDAGQDIISKSRIFFHLDNDEYEDKNKNAIVIGAGIAGCSMAYSLAIRGFKVTIIDKNDQAASQASGNIYASYYPKLSAGITDMSIFYQHSFLYLLNLLPRLKLKEWHQSGLIALAINDAEEIRQQKSKTLYPDSFLEYLDKNSLSDLAGIDLDHAGLYFKDAGYLSPIEVCKNMLKHENITQIFNINIDHIEKKDDKWRAVSRETLIASAPILICSNGSDISKFEQTKFLPVEIIRGQLNYLPSNDISKKIKAVICHKGYILPEEGNQNLFGATFTRDGNFDFEVRQKDTEYNLNELNTYIKSVNPDKDLSLDGRTGYRYFTPDRLPIIGKCPDYNWFNENYADIKHGKKYIDYPKPKYLDGLYINAGYGSHGITTAPFASEILANIINNENWKFPYNIYQSLNPARFIIRDLKSK